MNQDLQWWEDSVWNEDEELPESNLERAQRKKREEDRLRAQGKPTLHVKLGDVFLKPTRKR